MLQEIIENLQGIGLLISLILTFIFWINHYRNNKKAHPEFKELFWAFSIFNLIYTGIISSIISGYLILSSILGLDIIKVTADNLKYPLIIGSLALLYLGIARLRDKSI